MRFGFWITERRSSRDELRATLIDKGVVDTGSRTRLTFTDRVSTYSSKAVRYFKVQAAPFLWHAKIRCFLVFSILCLFVIFFFGSIRSHSIEAVSYQVSSRFPNTLHYKRCCCLDINNLLQQSVWDDLSSYLESVNPGIVAPKRINEAIWPARYTVDMPDSDIDALQQSHKNFVDLSSDLTLKGTYSPGTTGIVSTAAGRYLNVFLVSLRCLRRTGSTLPVELFLEADDEYDDYFCEILLPSLNARCKVMSHTIGTRLARKLEAFQIKPFAIMTSSFENVLFLDADNLSLGNPEKIFKSSIYEAMGLILWPDFLETSESPILAEIQSPFPAKWTGPKNISMESGQIFISKAIHEKTLFLASYYNYYGPSCYYSLFTQGGNGEGDKETFAAAAAYLRNPYYLVEEMVYGFGFFDSNSKDVIKSMEHFKNIGMIQFTPNWHGPGETLRPLFLHWNWPKLDAGRFLDEEHLLQDHTAVNHRVFEYARGPGDVFIPWSDISFRIDARGWGQDFEAIAIEEMVRVACVDLHKREGMEEACKRLRKHYRKVYFGDAI